MVVVAIPIVPSTLPSDLTVRRVNPPTLFGEEVLTRRPGVQIAAGVYNDFSVSLIDEEGNHLTLDPDATFRCRFAEGVKRYILIEERDCTPVDVDYAIMQVPIPESVSQTPGVYLASVGIFKNDKLRWTYDIWIYNEPSLWAAPTVCALPPIKELQLLLRDSSPVENELLGDRQFGIEEYAQAAVETVELWNNTPPFLGDLDTRNFPARSIYLAGIKTFLFSMLVEWYRKNRLPYTAGGVNADDMAKFQEYMVAVQKEEQDLRILIQRTKSSINIVGGFGKIG